MAEVEDSAEAEGVEVVELVAAREVEADWQTRTHRGSRRPGFPSAQTSQTLKAHTFPRLYRPT